MVTYIKATLEILDILPIATLYGLFGFALYAVIVIGYPVYLTYHTTCGHPCKDKHKVKNTTEARTPIKKFGQWISKKFKTGAILLYGGHKNHLQQFLENESTFGEDEMEDTWKRIQVTWLGIMLRINALSLLLFCGMVLWNVFLIDKKIECDKDSYCFIASNEADWHRVPIQNCSSVPEDKEIVCFKFMQSAGDAAAKAGGILTFGIHAMHFGSSAMFSILRLLKRCCRKNVYRVLVIVLQQLPVVILLMAAVLSVVFVRYRDFAFYDEFVEVFAVVSIVALVLATPWCVLIPDQESKKGDQTSDDSENNRRDDHKFPLVSFDQELKDQELKTSGDQTSGDSEDDTRNDHKFSIDDQELKGSSKHHEVTETEEIGEAPNRTPT